MNGFCGGMPFKYFDKRAVVYKEIFQKFLQIGIPDLTDIRSKLLIHSLHAFLRGGHIVRRIILSLLCPPDLFDIDLEIAVIADHISVYLDKILFFVFRDPLRVRIPHLPVKDTCFILKKQIIIWFPVSCLCGTFPFTQINIPDRLTFMKPVDISHFFPLSFSAILAAIFRLCTARSLFTSDSYSKIDIHITFRADPPAFDQNLLSCFHFEYRALI